MKNKNEIHVDLSYWSMLKNTWLDMQIKRRLVDRYYKGEYIGVKDKLSYSYTDFVCVGELFKWKDGATFEFTFDAIDKTMLSRRIS